MLHSGKEFQKLMSNNYNYQPVNPNPDPLPPVAPIANKTVSTSDMGDVRVDNINESYVDSQGNLTQRQEEVYDNPYQRRVNILNRATTIIYALVTALEVLLVMRLVFRLLGADPNNGLTNFVYNLSRPFVVAFDGIFADQKLTTNSVFEISTLVAMAMYALLAWGVVSFMYAIFRPDPSSRQNVVTTRRGRF